MSVARIGRQARRSCERRIARVLAVVLLHEDDCWDLAVISLLLLCMGSIRFLDRSAIGYRFQGRGNSGIMIGILNKAAV